MGASNLDQSEEDQERRTLGEKDGQTRGGQGRKEEPLLLGGVSAAPWSQVDRLRQEEGQGRGLLKLESQLFNLLVVESEQVTLLL